ncbi:MAG: diacylglycerol kinase family lipid kinase [Deltaproteobacteria bacterium]|nr:MAG: diacylglycerol kinase family lipid kinase [Deltaproteobacteria bacterium]
MNGSPRRLYAVVNPEAAFGKARRLWPKLLASLQTKIGPLTWDWTQAPNHASDLVRRALQQKHDLIISVGGDGTHNEVINGFFMNGTMLNSQAVLAVVPCGSGSDFSRSLGVAGGMNSTIATILSGKEREVDLGHLRFRLPTGEDCERFFLNVASLGLPARVCSSLASQPRVFGGSGRYFLATVRALMSNRNETITLKIDGKSLPEQLVNTVVAANGRFFGGGMRVAPHAKLDDGQLDLVVIGAVKLRHFFRWGLRFYRGNHLNLPPVRYLRASTVGAFSQRPVPVEADGETVGLLPVTFTILPRAIRVLVAL